jgi:shikimate kinase
MGAGKTTVGRALAKRTGLAFIDLDHYIESRYLRSVPQLFQEEGEARFRQIEQKMLREVAQFEDVIISTGGGAPCFSDNMALMNEAGRTVYLSVSVAELTKRLEVCKGTRPVLKGRTGEELQAFVAESLAKREAYYRRASVVLDAEVMLTDTDVETITIALQKIILS